MVSLYTAYMHPWSLATLRLKSEINVLGFVFLLYFSWKKKYKNYFELFFFLIKRENYNSVKFGVKGSKKVIKILICMY